MGGAILVCAVCIILWYNRSHYGKLGAMMNKQFTRAVVCVALASMMSLPALAQKTSDPNIKVAGLAQWQQKKRIDIKALSERQVVHGEASIFFVREVDADAPQTSVNIAVNGRYQVSLQAGHFSQVISCSGINELSAVITGQKSNNLLFNAKQFDLQSRGTYFFFVEVDEQGVSAISPMSHDYAVQYILDNEMRYQAHQVSRVEKTGCTTPISPPPAEPVPVPDEPVASEPIKLELEILFDNDKAIIKPEYHAQIADVARFMQEQPNLTAVIEGHTDDQASDEYNQALSQRRVDAVRLLLVEQYSIEPTRLSAIGYGESRPRVSNETREGRRQNRRVVVLFSGQATAKPPVFTSKQADEQPSGEQMSEQVSETVVHNEQPSSEQAKTPVQNEQAPSEQTPSEQAPSEQTPSKPTGDKPTNE